MESSPIIRLTLGTAGHIDHGKTSVIRALTGYWCDRLPEEKSRGMTIDLGFTHWDLPDGRTVGIIDVPGHERFVHTMVAGVSGIDLAMLVVAADDGVMPQTLEHLQILRLLNVQSGLIVVNKADLATRERLEEVELEIREAARGSVFEEAPCVPFSANTGKGIEELARTTVRVIDQTRPLAAKGPFLLHIERVFTLKGIGTVVTGIPRSGSLKVGDSVELLPGGSLHRVKGIQIYNTPSQTSFAGALTALRLSDLSREEVRRGKVLALPGYFAPHRFFNVRFHLLPQAGKALRRRTAVIFHVGTSETPGYLVLATRDSPREGESCYAQIQLDRPAVAAPGDLYVVRRRSPAQTLGGGKVIDCSDTRLRQNREGWQETRQALEEVEGDLCRGLLLALKSTGPTPCHLDNWAKKALVHPGEIGKAVSQLVEEGAVIELPGRRFVTRESYEACKSELIRRLNALHDTHPLYRGFEKRSILLGFPGSRLLLDTLFDRLLEDGTLVAEANRYLLKAREPRLDEGERFLRDTLAEYYRDLAFETPNPNQLPELLDLSPEECSEMIVHLVQTGTLVEIETHVLLHRDTLNLSRELLEEHFRQYTALEVGDCKRLFNTSRRVTIPLLEYWDRQGLTLRQGALRTLNKEKRE